MLEWKIGDCQDLMQEMEPDSVDLIATDPPYGYSFMGKDWDKVVPPVALWKEALRVLKPGAFAFIMSAPRQDVLAHNLVNLSDAGFDTGFTSIYWAYASGFPKASNIGKMIDKRAGAEREVIGTRPMQGTPVFSEAENGGINSPDRTAKNGYMIDITLPATPQAKSLDGSYGGFQPKPAVEVIMVVMKPLEESTYVDQALANGKGITWLDDGRIPYKNDDDLKKVESGQINKNRGITNTYKTSSFNASSTKFNPNETSINGRFPANLLVSDDVLNDGTTRSSCKSSVDHIEYGDDFKFGGGVSNPANQYDDSGSFSRYFDLDAWFDTKNLPKESQKTFPFLITPKASKSEKSGATHPTVKPVKLFSWLMTIGSRKGDLVLDPFLGSGTALEAGYFVGRDILGFEIDPQWEKLYPTRAHTHQGNLGDWFE